MGRHLAWPLLAALLAACAGPGAGRGRAGPGDWRQLTTGRFDLLTDLEPGRARRLAADLERLHATLAAALPDAPGARPGRARVVAFADRAALAELAGPRVAGYFTTAPGQPTIVVGDAGREGRTVLAHELTHLLLAERLPGAPPWLAEGLAEYLETVGSAEAMGRVGLRPDWARPDWRPRQGFARHLFRWAGAADPRDPRHEPERAWLLVAYLATEEPVRLDALLRRLQRGEPAGAAWDAVFPEWGASDVVGPEVLEIRATRALARGRVVTRRYQVRPGAVVSERPLGRADARALRLELPRRHRRTVPELRAEVAALLAADPHHPVGLRWRAQLDGLPALPLARRAVAAHPGDWRAWHFLGSALHAPRHRAERIRVLARAAALAPHHREPRLALRRALREEGVVARAAPAPSAGSGGD
jgi:hypothetical protein